MLKRILECENKKVDEILSEYRPENNINTNVWEGATHDCKWGFNESGYIIFAAKFKLISVESNNNEDKQLFEIDKALENAKRYLDYEENWDGEGSKGYKEKTLIRTKMLLYDCNKFLQDRFDFSLPKPNILPGPSSSVDILWETEHFGLLVNVPESEDEQISYYGHEKGGTQYIKGITKLNDHSCGLYLWLYEELMSD